MEETEVFELENGRDPNQEARRQSRVNARADLLWMYLKLYEGQDKRFTQPELSEVLALGKSQQALKEVIHALEERGWLEVDRSHRPHRYTLSH